MELPITLTPRQQDVLRGIIAGDSNQQIGRQLFIAESTVKQVVRVLFDKLGAKNRTQAAVTAILRGYI